MCSSRPGRDQPRRARYRVQRPLWRPGNPGGSGASAYPAGQLLRAAARGEISEGTELDWDPRTAVDVVMAAENYPDTPRKGDVISGLDEANALEGVHVIHAGTAASEEGVLTAGGRAGCCCSAMTWLLPVTLPTRVFALSLGWRTVPYRYRVEGCGEPHPHSCSA